MQKLSLQTILIADINHTRSSVIDPVNTEFTKYYGIK